MFTDWIDWIGGWQNVALLLAVLANVVVFIDNVRRNLLLARLQREIAVQLETLRKLNNLNTELNQRGEAQLAAFTRFTRWFGFSDDDEKKDTIH